MLYKGGSTKQRCALKRAQRRHMGQFGGMWTKSCSRVEPRNNVVRSNVPKGAIWGTSGAYGPNRVEGWSPETTLCAQTCPKAPNGAILEPVDQIVYKGGARKQRCALKRAKGAIWGTSGAYGPNRFEGWSPETTLCAQTCSNTLNGAIWGPVRNVCSRVETQNNVAHSDVPRDIDCVNLGAYRKNSMWG
ncbi:hypothetical protein RB195_012897 [Necator americanus]|uniref:Thrombospondin type 1 domain protein n=1 Tax=Necator americanus TaxID=51031 RepID=A0ABR1DT25_NECAM